MLRTNMALQLKLSGNARVTRSNAYGAQAPDSIPEKLSDGSCTEWKLFSDAYPKKNITPVFFHVVPRCQDHGENAQLRFTASV